MASPATRPFKMGFTRWPSDLTLEGVQIAVDFAHHHGDVVSVMFIGGIPWTEALAGAPYSADVEANLSYRPPKGTQTFLSISPLDQLRSGLAPYWGAKDNMPLPPGWEFKAFDDSDVITAFKRFTLDATARMKPSYLAIAIEANILRSKNRAAWPGFVKLYTETRAAVKEKFPGLPVFFTTEISHYLEMNPEDAGSNQAQAIGDLMKDSDYFAMSLYPYMGFTWPRPFTSDRLDFARKFKKPIVVSESGFTSQDVVLPTWGVTLRGTPEEQRDFEMEVFKAARADRYSFVINFATTDFPQLCAKIGGAQGELASVWQYTGMQTDQGQPKLAQAVWDAEFRAVFDPSRKRMER